MSSGGTLLAVEGLNAHYGSAHVLQDVSFELGEQAVAIVGRNGMGKTTLCAAIMGISPPRTSGSVRFGGKELVGMSSHRIANLGIVPGSSVRLLQKRPSVVLEVGETTVALDTEIASELYVRRLSGEGTA